MTRTGVVAGVVVLVALSAGVPAPGQQQASVPDLPTPVISDLPAEVRDQVRQAAELARKNPRDADASGKLGMLLDLYNRPDQAAICYSRASSLDPKAFKWLYYLGSLQARRGRAAEAVATFRAALKLGPDYLPARLKLAEALFNTGDLDASSTIYSAIVREHPDTAEAYHGLGRIYLARGEPATALPFFRKAAELFPNYGAAHYELAQLDRKLGKTDESGQELALYDKNKTLVPPIEDPLRDELRSLDRSAASLVERGVQLEQAGRLEDAIGVQERALTLDPNLMQAHVNLMILYGRRGDFAKAEEHYRAALNLDPSKYPEAYYNYGVLMIKENRFDSAQAAFAKALDIRPSYPDAHNDLGYIYERQGKLDAAAAEYRKATEERPGFRKARFNLARILVSEEKYSEGIEQLRQTLLPDDEDAPAYVYALGAAYGRAGDNVQAAKYLREAEEKAKIHGQSELRAAIERDLQNLANRQN